MLETFENPFFESMYYGLLDKDNFLVHKIIMKQSRSLFRSSKIWWCKKFTRNNLNWNFIKNIGLVTKSFRIFPLDDFSRSKSFLSIANFKPIMVFDSWCSIVSSFVVYLLFCIDFKWRFHTVIFVTYYFITSEKVKTQCKLGKSCMRFMVKNHWQNASVRIVARFRSGDFALKGAPRSGRPTEVDDDKIKAMIENMTDVVRH